MIRYVPVFDGPMGLSFVPYDRLQGPAAVVAVACRFDAAHDTRPALDRDAGRLFVPRLGPAGWFSPEGFLASARAGWFRLRVYYDLLDAPGRGRGGEGVKRPAGASAGAGRGKGRGRAGNASGARPGAPAGAGGRKGRSLRKGVA